MMIPQYNTVLFTDIYDTVNDFMEDYESNPFPKMITDDSARVIYYLLLANYANNSIANLDIDQFKNRLFATIYQYAPTWEKRIEIQKRLRELSEDDLRQSAKQIANNALNPDEAPTTSSMEELDYISSQNTVNTKKGIITAYQDLWSLLKIDVTESFINEFKKLFIQVVIPQRTYIYKVDEE